MNKLEKLLSKISKKDRENLLKILVKIINGDNNLKIVKIKDTDFFRIRFRQFRIIFHKENREVIIDNIRLRNNTTYKNL